jgi:hypothetical protein
MINTLHYPYFTNDALVREIIGYGVSSCDNPVFNWLINGRLPETRIVTPSDTTQIVTPSAKNKYLESVVIEPVEVTPLTVTPSTEEQTFSAGYYNPVVVEATA